MSVESKKIAILRILDILEKESDEQNPLTYEKIENLLYTRFGIEIERKAIARNISLLNEAGYPIKVTNKGSYLENRLLENAEIRLLIDSILSSRYLNEKHSKEQNSCHNRSYRTVSPDTNHTFQNSAACSGRSEDRQQIKQPVRKQQEKCI